MTWEGDGRWQQTEGSTVKALDRLLKVAVTVEVHSRDGGRVIRW